MMLQALSFLTVAGRAAPRTTRRPTPLALPWFPIVGALIGLAVGYVWWGAGRLWPPLVAAAIALVADAAVTGRLHLDGLSDSADGLLAPMDRERRLAVMRDPSVGSFGAVALIVVLLMRLSVFASLPAAPLTVAALWCTSRASMAMITVTLPYARTSGGLASALLGARRGAVLGMTTALALVVSVPLALAGSGWHGLVAVAAAPVGAVAPAPLARARLDGFTGDVRGAAGVSGEPVGLVTWAAL
jgi:adenosylcobinamide-GDP ribazoletransferase